MKNKFSIFSFYRFIRIKDKKLIKTKLDECLSQYNVKGTILLANEGINGALSASKKDLNSIIKLIRELLKIRNLNLKINTTSFLPFNKVKVRLKKEIVSLGKGKIDVRKNNYVDPSEWNLIIKNKDIKVIDVRNNFEIDIGKFQDSLNPKTKSFREFPNKIKQLDLQKDSRIAMYCTGGIRCEKASSYLKANGYKDVVQLKGGIINYLEYTKKNKTINLWNGQCFVFDNRVTINRNLLIGDYLQCFGCRRPIKKKDTKSKYYLKGVHCPHCVNERSDEQKKKSITRQGQLDKINRSQLLSYKLRIL